MLETVFTREIIQILAIESPTVILAIFTIWALMHVLVKALNVIVDLANTLKEFHEAGQ